MGKRLLITGYRYWTDDAVIHAALSDVYFEWKIAEGDPKDFVMIEGECPYGGADIIARDIWETWGLSVERHPAKYDADGKILGLERNAEMIASGADLCLAFIHPFSRGARSCARNAERADIPVRRFFSS